MQFLTLLAAALSTFVAAAVAAPGENSLKAVETSAVSETVLVGYTLDLNPTTYLSSLSCSATFAQQYPNFHTLSDLPPIAFYGEAPGAVDSSSPQLCGSCWQLQDNGQAPVYMIAVDNASTFQLSKPEFDQFAGTQGGEQGSVTATAVQVDSSRCGLQPM